VDPGSEQGPPEDPRMRALGNFRGDDYWHNSQAWGLNDRGLVVGWANGTVLRSAGRRMVRADDRRRPA